MKKGRNNLGTTSLGAAFAGFLFLSFQPWIPLDGLLLFPGLSLGRLLRAFFEASLVGALADWFAVTALFRDPLGLKLPHTNILAKNKDAIAEAVPRFLSSFVSDDKIEGELLKVDFASKAEELLAPGETREELHGFLRGRVSALLSSFADGASAPDAPPSRMEGLRSFVRELLSFASERIDPGAAFAGLIRWAEREGFDERVFEGLADLLRSEIGKNRARLAAAITPIIKRNAGWQGLFVGQGTVERLLVGLQEELADIRRDKRHALRRFFLGAVERYAAILAGEAADPEGERERFAAGIRDALADESFRSGFADFIADMLRRIGSDLSSPESRFLEGLERIEDALETRLARDGELRARFNRGAAGLVSGLIARSRIVEGLTDYLSGLLKKTDDREFVRRVEGAVWNDLQYIRVNGAIVGGLVGVVLALLAAVLGR
jgi:uncharacterized membrane-anchored protein YjiN (DUF445 family)